MVIAGRFIRCFGIGPAALVLTAIFSAGAAAQNGSGRTAIRQTATAPLQGVNFSFNSTGIGSTADNGGMGLFQGQGTITPFGGAILTSTILIPPKDIGTAIVFIDFANVGTGGVGLDDSLPFFTAFCPGAAYSFDSVTAAVMVSGTCSYEAGTQQFKGASGSATFSMTYNSTENNQMTVSGSGFITSYQIQQSLQSQGVQSSVQSISSQVNLQTATKQLSSQLGLSTGSQPATYSASSTTNSASGTSSSGSSWLNVSPSSGTLPANSQTTVTATQNATSMQAGVYQGNVQINASTTTNMGSQFRLTAAGSNSTNTSLNIPVSLILTNGDQMQLSQSGVSFITSATNTNPLATSILSQSVTIGSSGIAALPVSASASTASGGNWLSVILQGSETATSSSPVSALIQANPINLDVGSYSGWVYFGSPTASNSPQSVTVTLTVVPPADFETKPVFTPAGLEFTGPAGGVIAAQTVTVLNTSAVSITVSTQTTSDTGVSFFSTGPGGVILPGKSTTFTVAPGGGFGAGIYTGAINFQIAETSATYTVPVTLILSPAATAAPAAPALERRQTSAAIACTPTQLVPVITSLLGGFQVTADLPVPVQAQIADDCGTPLTAGQAVVSFTSNDPSVFLNPVGNGLWSGTWFPLSSAAGGTVSLAVTANSSTPPLQGLAALTGTLAANPDAPEISPGGVVSAASLAVNAPLAPGSFISIFGTNFGSSSTAYPLPYVPGAAGGVQVLLGGESLPLQFAGAQQINAMVPYDIPVNQIQNLTVATAAGTISPPQSVILAAAQPSIFSLNNSGSGPGAIQADRNGAVFLVASTAPATAGDAVIVYCTGLGAVSPAVPAGSISPSLPPAQTVNPVTVTIGDVPAQVFFAGLAPGFSGLYQVNAYVPTGITPGSSVPVVVSEGGASSPPVTIAIQ